MTWQKETLLTQRDFQIDKNRREISMSQTFVVLAKNANNVVTFDLHSSTRGRKKRGISDVIGERVHVYKRENTFEFAL